MKRQWYFCLLLTLFFTMSACEANKVKTPMAKTTVVPVFTLAWSEYPSWSTFGVMDAYGIINGEAGQMSDLEKKYNVDIVLKEADYDTCIVNYGAGVVDASCLANIDVLSPSLGRSTRAILPTSTSDSADAVLSVEATTLADLKGKKVYGLDKSVSEYTYRRILEVNGLNPDEFEFVGQDPAVASQSMQQSSPNVKSICVWNPYKLQTLKNRPEVKVIADSSSLPGEIVDMVVVGEDVFKREGADRFCTCLCEGFYQICNMLEEPATRSNTLVALGSKFGDFTADQMATCCQETRFYKTKDQGISLFTAPEFSENMKKVVKFTVFKGMCEKEPKVSFGNSAEANLVFDARFMQATK